MQDQVLRTKFPRLRRGLFSRNVHIDDWSQRQQQRWNRW